MWEEFSRTALLIGEEALEKLQRSRVAVFGIGGVGTFVVEGLVRGGIGHFVLVDHDTVTLSNFNRQIHATNKTLHRPKVEVMKERILDINPRAEVVIHQSFYLPETRATLIEENYDYIVDAVDTVTAKVDLVVTAKKLQIPIISSMGAGNKLDPTKFQVADIYRTSVCPLARVMRKELRKRDIPALKVVFSTEEPIKLRYASSDSFDERKKQVPGSISFLPSVAGLIIAGEVIKDLIKAESSEI
ncbi:tRNA threonylcarbamoyladenosine dehydratase [Dehalobacterium formicoaceticum]|uniref:tRNA threonylcarbamoyladenosine dehydratase n=1 Tax=Dehalobacterium formicoaceticum TaxID=51515 RepID=A0ABT1Y0D0_9FIRM|nr:tRNA threonylcarbamoyladenosine dehydratase [Dehalobacterium formicoaceticum]MCR6544324.1 tRNA threonylcarbamoyladenosine dehydratase [Dehalobacterium formicoaceticum]